MDYLSIDGLILITVGVFTIQILRTCGRAYQLLPLAVCMATAEIKEVLCPFLVALLEEVEKDGMPWAPTNGMADHADAFRYERIAEFSGMEVADCFLYVAKKVRDKAPMRGSFHKPLMTRGCRAWEWGRE